VTVNFAFLIVVIKLCWMLFLGTSEEDAKEKVSRENLTIVALFCIFGFYTFM
jgi:hypothetical protein